MGHYWSEIRPDEPERHPRPLEAMDFVEAGIGYGNDFWYHRPCGQVFFLGHAKERVPDHIYQHANRCKLGPVE